MNTRLTIATLAILTGLGGAAQAEILASAPLYGGSILGAQINCRIFNAGVTPVTITSRQILTNTNVSLPLAYDSCNVPLGPSKYCGFGVILSGNFAHTCRIVAIGTDPDIRGVAEFFSGSTVHTLPMQ